LYDMRFVKPLDAKLMTEIAGKFKKIMTFEDGTIQGGFGSAVLEYLSDNGLHLSVKRHGIPDNFVEHGTPEDLYNLLGLDVEGIAKSISDYLKD
jgi:1-deoxy-D-xylulose-5-phosphate synthase